MDQNELYHHGIKGQKWYIRRFQNADGTLTALGKKRYGTSETFERKKAQWVSDKKSKGSKSSKSSTSESDKKEEQLSREEYVRRNIRNMSDEEIRRTISRIDLENQLMSKIPPREKTRGEKIASGMKNVIVKDVAPAVIEAGKKEFTKYVNRELEKALGNNVKSPHDIEKAKLKKENELLELRRDRKKMTEYLEGKTDFNGKYFDKSKQVKDDDEKKKKG